MPSLARNLALRYHCLPIFLIQLRTRTMKRTFVADLTNKFNETVKINGWIQTIRDQKKMQFLVLRDHTGMAQAINDKGQNEAAAQLIANLTPESAVEVVGKVVANASVKLKGLEIVIESLQVLNLSDPQLPIDDNTALDGRLNWRFLDLRKPQNGLVFKVQTLVEHAMRKFWQQEGFIEIHSPKLMGSASESGAELFRVKYFDRKAYLAQSPQFYKQMAMAAGFDRVFEIGPVFRANPSFTSRHDTEFTSIDVEMSWIESHDEVMEFEEAWLQHAIGQVSQTHGEEIKECFGVDVIVPSLPFPRIQLSEARQILADCGHVIEHKSDLDPPGERGIADYIAKKFSHEFVFVTDYPIDVRPFYHMRHENDPTLTKSFDLLWRGLEITTGAQREHRIDVLKKQAVEKGIELDSIKHYIDFFRYGCPPHGGFGAGLTRLLMIILDRKNVREVTYLYRGPNR